MALWCRQCPVVTVPRGEAKPVTFVYAYYENQEFLARQMETWNAYDQSLSDHISVIVVDDGSPEPAKPKCQMLCEFRLFRIHEDRRWNWLAARNIGAHHAPDGWLFLSDMDHVVPVETAETMVHGQHDPKVVYAFSRKEHTGDTVNPHSASFLITRAMFWKTGGYDEILSGFYGSDGDFRRRLSKVAPIHVLTDVLVRHEYQGDSSTTRYERKQPQDAAVGRLVAARGPNWQPKVLSFDYHEVAL